jgi:excisionase family DNA binding protein
LCSILLLLLLFIAIILITQPSVAVNINLHESTTGGFNMSSDKLCISISELAKNLGVSRPVAYQIARRQDFPSITVGRRILVPLDGLEKWLAEKHGKQISLFDR